MDVPPDSTGIITEMLTVPWVLVVVGVLALVVLFIAAGHSEDD
jgi:hypothetical protein